MNVRELEAFLNKVTNKTQKVILSADGEGNSFRELAECEVNFIETEDNYHYDVLDPSTVEEFQLEDPKYVPQQGLILWP